jgi:hypothetical protein
VAEELASVLSSKASFEFKPLFLQVHANLKARNAASGGEEMLRLRAYQRLQEFVAAGAVTKDGKEYKGVKAKLKAFMEASAAVNAEAEERKKKRAKALGGK